MEFARPQMLWLFGFVPVAAFLIAWERRRATLSLRRFAGDRFADALAPGRSWRRDLWRGALRTGALALLIAAAAGPRWGLHRVRVERRGIDLVIALDTSLSMLAEDMKPSRLGRARQEIVDLIEGLQGDRVGLVAFAGSAYPVCPLTVDYDAAVMFARSIDVYTVSEPGTNLEAAIRRSVSLFDRAADRSRVIILVTDGESHEGDPAAAAAAAREAGIRIYPIGIGNPAGELIPERGQDGSVRGYKKDRRGKTVVTRLDEATLQRVAEISGGKYLPATTDALELQVLYDTIAGLHRSRIEGQFIERRRERFMVPAAIALVLLLVELLVPPRPRRGRAAGVLHTGAVAALVAALVAAAPVAARAAGRVDGARIRRGNAAYAAGDYARALALYRGALGDTSRAAGDAQGAWYDVGNALVMLGRHREAIEAYRRAWGPDTTLVGRMLYNRGNALLAAGQPAPAVASYVQALRYLPDDPDVRHNLEIALRVLREQRRRPSQRPDSSDGEEEAGDERSRSNGGAPPDSTRDRRGDDARRRPAPPDSTRGAPPDSARSPASSDSTRSTPPEPAGTRPRPDSLRAASIDSVRAMPVPLDSLGLTREDAMRILQALLEREQELQRRRRRAAFRRRTRGKDW